MSAPMFITCPVCSTRYDVNPAGLGSGKSVRCSNCGNQWFQHAVQDPPAAVIPGRAAPTPPPPPPPPSHPAYQQQAWGGGAPAPQYWGQPPAPPAYPGYPQPGYPPPPPPPGYAPPGYPPPPGYPDPNQPAAGQHQPAAPAQPMAEQSVPDGLYDSEPDADLDDLGMGDDLDGGAGSVEHLPSAIDEGASLFAEEDEPYSITEDEDLPSEEELEDMFSDQEDPEPIDSFVGGPSADDVDELEPMDPDDLPEPEPIPEVFTSGSDDDDLDEDDFDFDDDEDLDAPKSRGGIVIAIVAVIVVLLGSAGAGLFFAKDTVLGLVPQAQMIYDMLDFGGDELGAGLAIEKVTPSRDVVDGVDVLRVDGEVVNIVDTVVAVPYIKVLLFDGEGQEVQSSAIRPPIMELAPNEPMPFTIDVRNPVPTARRVEVTFSEPPEEMDGEKDGDSH